MEATVATTIDTTPACCDEEKCCEREKHDCVANYKQQIADLEKRLTVLKELVASLEGHTEVADKINALHDLDYGCCF